MKRIIIFIFFTVANFCTAQNLVNNPSLEDYSSCPNDLSQVDTALLWSNAVMWGGSSDYFNNCMLQVPINAFIIEIINKHSARTGDGFAGIIASAKLYSQGQDTLNYREAIQVKLKNNLTANNCYFASFYIKFNGFWINNLSMHVNYSIDNVGIFLGQDSIIYESPWFCDNLFNITPQISYNHPIQDSINWIKISGTFISTGNENKLTITNFVEDDLISFIFNPLHLNLIDSTIGVQSLYLIDDVAVYPCDAPVYVANAGNDTCIKPGNSVVIGTAGHSEYLYWWYDEQGNLVDTSAQITVYPTQTTTYTLVQKDFKFDETRDTVTVTVDAHCYEVVIPEIRIPNVISPNGDGINDKFVIENGKYYNIKLIIFNRWGNQIFESNDYQNNWPASDIADGVYFYILTSTNTKQEVKEYKGSVSVVR